MTDGTPRILVIRLSAIGDVVRVLPALHILREEFPGARIDWAVEAKAADVLEGHPALDRILVFERPAGARAALREFWALCRSARANRYDIVIDFHGILKSGLIAGFSGARDRYGFARPRSQEGSALFVNHRTALPSDKLNRVEENLTLCEAVAPGHDWPNVTIFVPQAVQASVDQFYDETFESGKRVVAMHVPMDRGEKRWPIEHYAALADLLLADGRFEVVLTWGPGQFECATQVAAKTRRHPVIAPEIPDLKHFAWLVHRSNLYFGGDTGPMHIAWVMGTPCVVVFGGTDPAKHAPYRQEHIVLRHDEMTPDGRKLSVEERLRRITPAAAFDACTRLALKNGQN